jgi:hypothetical protein
MKRSIIAYPDQEFSIGPGKSLTCREKYKDRTEKFSAISCRTGDCRLQPVSDGFVFIGENSLPTVDRVLRNAHTKRPA